MPDTQQIEIPFIYSFDGSGLTDGDSPRRLSIPLDLDFDRFRVRRIVGLSTLASSLMLYRESGQQVYSANQRLGVNCAMVPQLDWRASGDIVFDLGAVLRSNIGCGGNPIYTGFLGFQGVKSVQYPANQVYETQAPYKRIAYTYSTTLTIDWRRYTVPPILERPRSFVQKIDDYDFELCRIRAYQTNGTPVFAHCDWMVQLYTADRYALSNIPVPQGWVNDAMAGSWNSVFPVPGLVYRKNSFLRYDITSMICNLDGVFPKVYRLEFDGFQRVPVPLGSVEG